MKKILYIISSLKVGGAEICLANFLKELKQLKPHYQMHVAFFYKGPVEGMIRSMGIEVTSLAAHRKIYGYASWKKLNQLIKSFQPDLIHTSLWSANIIGRLAAWRHEIPLINEMHGDHAKLLSWWKNFCDARTIKKVSSMIVVSKGVLDAFQLTMKQHRASSLPEVIVIPNGISPMKKEMYKEPKHRISRSSLGIKEETFVFGAVGRMEKVKQFDFLLESFAQLVLKKQRLLKLLLVGDGSERERLERQAAELGIQQEVLFVGLQKAKDYYPIFDCLVQTSKTEGMSLVLLEALSFGVIPLVRFDGMNHEVITDRQEGFLIKSAANPEAFAKKMEEIMNDDQHHEKIQAACRLRSADFTIEKMTKKRCEIYDSL